MHTSSTRQMQVESLGRATTIAAKLPNYRLVTLRHLQ